MKSFTNITIGLFLLIAMLFAVCACGQAGQEPAEEPTYKFIHYSPDTDPATDPATEPESEPATEPASEPETDPVTDPVTEPATEPATEPEPETEPATEPVTDPVTEPITEPATEPEPETEPHVHVYGEWEVTVEPTFDNPGERVRSCVDGDDTQIEEIPQLVAAYHIDLYSGEEKIASIPVTEDGAYVLPDAPEKAGYAFAGWIDALDADFPADGTVSADAVAFAQYTLLETKTFDELKARIEGGADKILLAGDILLTDTTYVAGDVEITAAADCTLTRSPEFTGDLFVIGCTPDGEAKIGTLTIRPQEDVTVTIDGNKDAVTEPVSGTVFFLMNNSVLNVCEGVEIINCKKTANDRILSEDFSELSNANLVGGSVAILVNGTFNLNGGAIRNCEANAADPADEEEEADPAFASSRGGAVYNYGSTFHLIGGIIENCTAGRGGAVAMYHDATVTISGPASVSANTANKGGAIYNSDSSLSVGGEVLFQSNAATGSNGGAIAVYTGGEAQISGNVIFLNNTAVNNGGALYLYNESTAVIGTEEPSGENTTILFAGNQVTDSEYGGGAIYNSGSTLTLYALGGDQIQLGQNTSSKVGGAIAVYSSGTVTVTGDVTFAENEAQTNGGAIYNSNSTLSLDGAVLFQGNTTGTNGGAIAIYSGGDAEISGSVTFQENTAGNNGGAVYLYNESTAQISGNVTFRKNTAANNGGAVYLYNGSAAIIGTEVESDEGTEILFAENKTTSSEYGGGAIYNSGSAVTLYAVGEDQIVFDQNESSKNGGAIAVYSSGTVTGVGEILFSGNGAVGGGALYATNATVDFASMTATGNMASNNGGVIYIYEPTTAHFGTLNASGNTSDNYGGVLYITKASTAVIDSITATGNSAKQGGCIYITTTNTSITLKGGDITGNTATDGGNAIWSNTTKATVYIKGGTSQTDLQYGEGDVTGKDGKITVKEYTGA